MLSIQIISLIIFVIGIIVIPAIDQFFFYSRFNFKGVLNPTREKEPLEYKDNGSTATYDKENNKNINHDINEEIGDSSDDITKKKMIIGENSEVSKQEVKSGNEHLIMPSREERINVERNTVDRPATEADFKNFQERGFEMVERAEVPVVSKEARVVEEVSIGKNLEERNETIKDCVYKTQNVNNLEKDDLTNEHDL